MTANACAELARAADVIAAEHPTWSGDDFLTELAVRIAGIRRGPLSVLGLLLGGRTRLRGGGSATSSATAPPARPATSWASPAR